MLSQPLSHARVRHDGPTSLEPDCAGARPWVLCARADGHSCRHQRGRAGGELLVATGELPLSDDVWDALLRLWDGCLLLLLPPEHAAPAGDAREARGRAKPHAFADLAKRLRCGGPWYPHAARACSVQLLFHELVGWLCAGAKQCL